MEPEDLLDVIGEANEEYVHAAGTTRKEEPPEEQLSKL